MKIYRGEVCVSGSVVLGGGGLVVATRQGSAGGGGVQRASQRAPKLLDGGTCSGECGCDGRCRNANVKVDVDADVKVLRLWPSLRC